MEIQTEYFDQVALVRLGGRVDNSTINEFIETFDKLLSAGYKNIVLEIAAGTMLIGPALRGLLMVWKNCSEEGGDIRIVNHSEMVEEYLELGGFDTVFQSYDNVSSAVESFSTE